MSSNSPSFTPSNPPSYLGVDKNVTLLITLSLEMASTYTLVRLHLSQLVLEVLQLGRTDVVEVYRIKEQQNQVSSVGLKADRGNLPRLNTVGAAVGGKVARPEFGGGGTGSRE